MGVPLGPPVSVAPTAAPAALAQTHPRMHGPRALDTSPGKSSAVIWGLLPLNPRACE